MEWVTSSHSGSGEGAGGGGGNCVQVRIEE